MVRYGCSIYRVHEAQVTVAEPLLSVAVTPDRSQELRPVRVEARFISTGQLTNVGGMVSSIQVITCTQGALWLPEASTQCRYRSACA